jgi:hypothetical protein
MRRASHPILCGVNTAVGNTHCPLNTIKNKHLTQPGKQKHFILSRIAKHAAGRTCIGESVNGSELLDIHEYNTLQKLPHMSWMIGTSPCPPPPRWPPGPPTGRPHPSGPSTLPYEGMSVLPDVMETIEVKKIVLHSVTHNKFTMHIKIMQYTSQIFYQLWPTTASHVNRILPTTKNTSSIINE